MYLVQGLQGLTTQIRGTVILPVFQPHRHWDHRFVPPHPVPITFSALPGGGAFIAGWRSNPWLQCLSKQVLRMSYLADPSFTYNS